MTELPSSWTPETETDGIVVPTPTPAALHQIADALDAFDDLRGYQGERSMQRDVRSWAAEMAKAS